MKKKVMRDVLIEEIYRRMHVEEKIFFLSADFGAPALDKLREKFRDRFINVGIAEQNMINVATGLALEGFTVYAYAISAFITMRPYEQIRTNLSLMGQTKELNVNLIGVGSGLSYNVSGPTHHCLEDITIMRLFPNFILFSPSDCTLVEKFVDFTLNTRKPKYMRLEGKAVTQLYGENENIAFESGFHELIRGENVCLVSTGYMTQTAIKVAHDLLEKNINIGVIDVFLLKPLNEDLLFEAMKKYQRIVTLEEALIGGGGLDSLIASILTDRKACIDLRRIGFKDRHVFELGSREYLHEISGLGEGAIIKSLDMKRSSH